MAIMIRLKKFKFNHIMAFLFLLSFLTGSKSVSNTVDREQEIHDRIYKVRSEMKPGEWYLQNEKTSKVFIEMSQMNNIYTLLRLSHKNKKIIQEKNSELMKEIEKKIPQNSINEPGVIYRTSQTYVMIYMLALIHIVVEDETLRRVDSSLRMDDKNTTEKLIEAAYELLVSGEMVSSLLMAGSTHQLFKKPLEYFGSFIYSQKLAPIFKNLILSFTHSLVSFTGWEFGAQLWKEAINMLDYQLVDIVDAEFLKKNKNRLIVNAYRTIAKGRGRPDTKEVLDSKIILKQTFENILYILTIGNDGFIQWLFNSLRHRLLSGHFVSLILSMSSASAIGSTYLPLAAPLLSTFGVGLAGGLVSIYLIPEKQKHQITTTLKEAFLGGFSKHFEKNPSDRYFEYGFNNSSGDQKINDFYSNVDNEISLYDVIEMRRNFRQKQVEIYIDDLNYYYNLLLRDNSLLKSLYVIQDNPSYLAQDGKHDVIKITKKINELVANNYKNKESFFENLKNLISFYLTEAHYLSSLKTKEKNENISEYLENMVFTAESVASHFCGVSNSFFLIDLEKANKENTNNFLRSDHISEISTLCKFDQLPKPSFDYADLNPILKKMYDSAINAVFKISSGRFNEASFINERSKVLEHILSGL